VLKRPVHYHLFRHSSTTYYATKLNRQQLGYRRRFRMPPMWARIALRLRRPPVPRS
jgi:hypothetical protein